MIVILLDMCNKSNLNLKDFFKMDREFLGEIKEIIYNGI